MNRKIIASIIVFAIAFGSPIQVLALEKASRDALTFFKRYESEFANNMRRLEEYDRKMKLVTGAKAEDLKYDAEDIMDQVQRRYDLLEDQYSFTISNYPSDAAELRDGFGRIDDSYRKIRNFNMINL
jgi:tetrahydromethanopterin S-methyltransferase subunit G